MLPCAPSMQCEACTIELARLKTFKEKMLPVLSEGGMFTTGKGLFSRGDKIWVAYDSKMNVLTWKNMKLERNKPASQGSVALADLTRIDQRGSDITVIGAAGAQVVSVTAPNSATSDIWHHALTSLLTLRQALLGVPAVDVERLMADANASPPDDSVEADLLSRQRDVEGERRVESAKARLNRLDKEAKARKAKFAGVGMTHIARAMASKK